MLQSGQRKRLCGTLMADAEDLNEAWNVVSDINVVPLVEEVFRC